MRIHHGCWLIALAAPLSFVFAGCFSDYGDDCGRNVNLPCFWDSIPGCGDGEKADGEACDDGNNENCDGCRGDCSAVETGCGDGFLCADEECDDGAANANTGQCGPLCTAARCGDGFVQQGEECDDANATADDGCFDCVVECKIGGLPLQAKAAHLYKDPATLHCYVRADNTGKSWVSAQAACVGWGGALAGFATQEEYEAVVPQLSGKGEVWSGATDKAEEGVFVWDNGEPWGADLPWAAGEPDDSGADGPDAQDCLVIGAGNELFDRACNALSGYLCERPPGALPPGP